MAIDPAVRAVMAKINRQKGSGSIILGSEITQPVRETITTGSLSLDVALGGGWATNHWIEVVGHESVGKTLIVLKTIAANQKINPNFTTVWFATEDFSEPYAEMLGVDLTQVIVEDENVLETVCDHCIELIQTRKVDCIVIDSLPMLISKREMEGTMDDLQPGQAAFLTGKFFRKSNPSMKRSLTEDERAVTGFAINQWHDKIGGYGDPRTTPMGKTKNFVFYQRVDVQRKEYIKNTRDEPIGQVIKLVNIKNKISRPGRIGEVDAYIATGRGHKAGDYDTTKDTVAAGIAYNIIELHGSYYHFEENRWKGREGMATAIAADLAIRQRLRKAVLKAAAAPLPPPEDASAERPKKTGVRRSGTVRSEPAASSPARRKRVGGQAPRPEHRAVPNRVQNSAGGKSADNLKSR